VHPVASSVLISASTSSSLTCAPARAAIRATVPSTGAVTVCSIFIASTMTTGCPAATRSPSATFTASTVPGIGDRSTPPPAVVAGRHVAEGRRAVVEGRATGLVAEGDGDEGVGGAALGADLDGGVARAGEAPAGPGRGAQAPAVGDGPGGGVGGLQGRQVV